MQKNIHHLVGPAGLSDFKRIWQFIFLLNQGLKHDDYVFDIGCGTLRGGLPLIMYLNEGHYYGVDVRLEPINEGLKELKAFGLSSKSPRLFHVSDLNQLKLDRQFDVALAYSVLIHMEKEAVDDCFSLVKKTLKSTGAFYANVNLHDDAEEKNIGEFYEFGVYSRPLFFYQDLAEKHQLTIHSVGQLSELGHNLPGFSGANNQLMLAITHLKEA